MATRPAALLRREVSRAETLSLPATASFGGSGDRPSASSTSMSCGEHRPRRTNQPACGRVPWLPIGGVPRV